MRRAALALASGRARGRRRDGGAGRRPPPPSAASARRRGLDLVKPGTLTIGTDNPAYPPWFGGSARARRGRSTTRRAARATSRRSRTRSRSSSASRRREVQWTYVPFNRSFAPGKKSFDFDINQISYSPARAKVVTFSNSYYDVNQAIVVLKGTKIANVHTRRRAPAVQARRAARDDELPVHQGHDQAVLEAGGLPAERRRGPGAEEQADRRARRRPPDRLLRHRRPGAEREDPRPVPDGRRRRALRDGLREGQLARRRASTARSRS